MLGTKDLGSEIAGIGVSSVGVSMEIEGASGALMVGMTGAEAVEVGIEGLN